MDETFTNIAFYGNKVLTLKQENDTKWYNAYRDIAKAFKDFIIENDKSGELEWKGSQNATDFFKSQKGQTYKQKDGASAGPTAQNALMAQIQQQALDSQNKFKHVDKNQHKADVKS